jgi:hypothetical protein
VIEWVWGRGLIEPDRAHIRETRGGIPVISLVEGAMVGYALCGAWLVADIAPDERERFVNCSRCLRIAAEVERGDLPEPDWSGFQ